MNRPSDSSATILIASDSATDAKLVKSLLKVEFERVSTSTHPEEAAKDFDRLRPDVLVLAFGKLEKSECYNLGLFRHSLEIHQKPHRTLIFCHKDEIQRAYELCRAGVFDDYILFWPLAYDGSRLPMAVHRALHDLKAGQAAGATPKELDAQVRRLGQLETLLKQQMAQGDEHIEATCRAIEQAKQKIGMAISGFSERLVQGDLSDLVEVRNANALEQAFDRLAQETQEGPLSVLSQSMQPLKVWANGFRTASATQWTPISSLGTMVEPDQMTILVVDDDPFQHKIIDQILKGKGFHLLFVCSGIEAMNILHKTRPDLILMDIAMPNMDGLDATRRIKGVVRFADIPIIMITSNSDEHVVRECLKAGAVDFILKPISGKAMIEKITKILGDHAPLGAEPLSELIQCDLLDS